MSDGRGAGLTSKHVIYLSTNISNWNSFAYNLQPWAYKFLNKNLKEGNIVVSGSSVQFQLKWLSQAAVIRLLLHLICKSLAAGQESVDTWCFKWHYISTTYRFLLGWRWMPVSSLAEIVCNFKISCVRECSSVAGKATEECSLFIVY